MAIWKRSSSVTRSRILQPSWRQAETIKRELEAEALKAKIAEEAKAKESLPRKRRKLLPGFDQFMVNLMDAEDRRDARKRSKGNILQLSSAGT